MSDEPLTPEQQRRHDALVRRGVHPTRAAKYALATHDATFWGKIQHADELIRMRPNLKNRGGFVLTILDDHEHRYGVPPQRVPPPPLLDAQPGAEQESGDPRPALRFLLLPHLGPEQCDRLLARLPDAQGALREALQALREQRLAEFARALASGAP